MQEVKCAWNQAWKLVCGHVVRGRPVPLTLTAGDGLYCPACHEWVPVLLSAQSEVSAWVWQPRVNGGGGLG